MMKCHVHTHESISTERNISETKCPRKILIGIACPWDEISLGRNFPEFPPEGSCYIFSYIQYTYMFTGYITATKAIPDLMSKHRQRMPRAQCVRLSRRGPDYQIAVWAPLRTVKLGTGRWLVSLQSSYQAEDKHTSTWR
jgi:hypothetical protein